jgi:hypothetical protein
VLVTDADIEELQVVLTRRDKVAMEIGLTLCAVVDHPTWSKTLPGIVHLFLNGYTFSA